ncbi:MAG: ankyrin repeat domain-containing protein [Elusimicrobia bacterium]|nr:ankyrin repeat domain-containing protein [Elusimicrobiota bacterium]
MPETSTASALLLTLAALTAGCTASRLYTAAERGDLAAVRAEVEGGAAVNEVSGAQDAVPMARAALNGHLEIVSYLLDHGGDPNFFKSNDYSPLGAAASKGHLEVARVLLERGADPNRPCYGGLPLAQAAIAGHEDVVRLLLERGADVNGSQRSTFSGTALGAAAYEGHEAIVRLLLERGADPSIRGTPDAAMAGWKTPLELAQVKQFSSITKILKQAEARTLSTAPAAAGPSAARAVLSDVDHPGYHRAPRTKDFALVVGIEKYSKLPDAPFAERDADAVKAHLLALGIPERNIVMLKGGAATRGSLQGYLEEWLPKNAGPASTIFFYYSGHGAPDPKSGEAFLVPWDGDAAFLQSTAYPLNKLYKALGSLTANQVIVVLDSCFSGAGGRSVLAKGARPLVTRVEAGALPPSVALLAAAKGDEITGTIDGQGHGIFTYYLLKGLNEGAASTASLFNYLKPKVQDEAHRQNREQHPTRTGRDAAF